MGRRLNLLGLAPVHRIALVGQYRQPVEIGNDFAQEFYLFADGIDTLDRQARHVATRPRQACATSPLPTGSPMATATIGMTDVARLAAIVGGVA